MGSTTVRATLPSPWPRELITSFVALPSPLPRLVLSELPAKLLQNLLADAARLPSTRRADGIESLLGHSVRKKKLRLGPGEHSSGLEPEHARVTRVEKRHLVLCLTDLPIEPRANVTDGIRSLHDAYTHAVSIRAVTKTRSNPPVRSGEVGRVASSSEAQRTEKVVGPKPKLGPALCLRPHDAQG